MTIAIHLEIGHDASLRTKTTPEGFTHDWEVFVRGFNSAEIHHYIEKVVFHLHETFPKPRRVVKEPPFTLRTSGYAGFTLPIEIYLRNNQEPKKIWFNYELVLQPSGPPIHNVQKEKYVFHNPSDEFKSRLLKGGAIVTSSGSNQETISSSNKIDERNQMTSKPRLSGSDVVKKHKMKLEEPKNSDFLNLFGTPITKTSKSLESTKPKEPPKPILKPESKGDKDKEKSDKSKSTKSSHKDREKEKEKSKDRFTENSEKKNKQEKKKSKDDKSKERERSKEKSFKKERDKERERSPRLPSHSPSPKRSPKRSSSPPPVPPKTAPIKEKEYYKDEKKDKEREEKRDKKDEKKTKKDKRDHKDKDKHKDRDKEKEHKDYKNKDSKSIKEVPSFKSKDSSPISIPQAAPQVNKIDRKEKNKEKESPKESPKEEERTEKNRTEKIDDKSQKHKHKKKDKKEKREERHTKSEKKSEKQANSTNKFKEMIKEPSVPILSSRESDKSNLFGSPKSEPPSTPDQENHKTTNNVAFKDDDSSIESIRGSSREPSPVTKVPSRSSSPMEIEPLKKVEIEKVKVKEESPKKKEKKEKKKDKKSDKDHDKKRKRKNENASQEIDEPSEKVPKEEENNNSDDEIKVSSTEDINPIPKSECDMDMLRDLQHKIMSLKDNADLQKVVQLIAETGQYEVSANTFDFDLCLLDQSTVKQLQDFFSTVS